MKRLITFIACFFTIANAQAKVFLPAVYSNHMVLQQKSAVKIWGWSEVEEKITITTSWDTVTYKAEGNAYAKWQTTLQTPVAGGPHTITVKGAYNTIIIEDVLIGEVWLASGQSNMEMTTWWGLPYEEEVKKATNTQIRFFHIGRSSSPFPQEDVRAEWVVCNPEAMKGFSAAAYFFGKKKKRAGISLGISYTGFAATYEVTDAAVYTFKSNDGQDDYRRRITLNNGSREEIDYTILNLPVLFKYRDFFGKGNPDRKLYKWNWEFSAGPSFIMFNNTAKYNSNIDFEGMYQVDTINQDAVTYYDYFDNASTWNVLLTADDINQQDSIPGAGAVFGLLNDHGYDFAFGKNYTGQDKKASRSSIAFNGRFDVCHRFDEKGNVAIKFGASICAAPLPDQSSGYELIDKTSDPYNSIYNSNAKSVYFSYGLNAGIILRW